VGFNMLPENARVFLAEDNEAVRFFVKKSLEETGHQVLVEAVSFEEAMEKIREAKEKRINVAVLDGSLPDNSSHGPKIAEALRQAIPDIRIVALSGEEVNWGDKNLHKPEDVSRVGEYVRNLT